MISFDAADIGVSPSHWQRTRYPTDWLARITQIHDGIDTQFVAPATDAKVSLGGTAVGADDEVVTYVARNLEPYRGFHTFMRAVPLILEQRPQARVLVVGADGVSYGRNAPAGQTYREHLLAAWSDDVDRSRVHFLGRLAYTDYLRVLQVSSLHVYLTYPFVLSWSMLEAMSTGCLVLGANTAPVREVIQEGQNGFLVDFFDAQAIANRACELLKSRAELGALKRAARATVVSQYDLRSICLPKWVQLLDDHFDRVDFPSGMDDR